MVPLRWRRGGALHGYMVLPRRVVYGVGRDGMADLECCGADASAEVTCRRLACRDRFFKSSQVKSREKNAVQQMISRLVV